MTTAEEFLARAIDPREFDDPGFQHDPFGLYKRLRDDHPVYHDRFHNRWIISRYEDIDAAFQDNESYDRAVYEPGGPYDFGSEHVFGPNILEYGNCPHHRWLRNIVAGQFVGKKLDAFLPIIDQIAGELIDTFEGGGEVELVKQFSNQFPIRVISNMLGLPREDEDTFVGWYQALIAGLGFGGEHLMRGIGARNDMWAYLEPLIREREKKPGDDLLSQIVGAELNGTRMNVVSHDVHAPGSVRRRAGESRVVDQCVYRNDAVRPGGSHAVPAHDPGSQNPQQGHSQTRRRHALSRRR
jgi:pulcherriminic acid synthase